MILLTDDIMLLLLYTPNTINCLHSLISRMTDMHHPLSLNGHSTTNHVNSGTKCHTRKKLMHLRYYSYRGVD